MLALNQNPLTCQNPQRCSPDSSWTDLPECSCPPLDVEGALETENSTWYTHSLWLLKFPRSPQWLCEETSRCRWLSATFLGSRSTPLKRCQWLGSSHCWLFNVSVLDGLIQPAMGGGLLSTHTAPPTTPRAELATAAGGSGDPEKTSLSEMTGAVPEEYCNNLS